MHLQQLRDLYKEALEHPNYQHNNKPAQEIDTLSFKSFDRLTVAQQGAAITSWKKFVGLEGAEYSLKELVNHRFMCQTNLFFLCHVLEKYNQTTLKTHEDICNKFFVRKDPTYNTFEQFANQYTELKDRMLLVPRGGFKSSIDLADCVQWIICYPAITILILTGVYKLAGDFVGELREHFLLEEDPSIMVKKKAGFSPKKMMNRDTGEWSISIFQVLFPEHCIQPSEGIANEFQTPAGGDEKEPTVRAASIEQALSGMHFGVLKLDDVATNENTQTPDRIIKVNKQIGINRAMLHPYGFMDIIGTWYDEADYYGVKLGQELSFAKEQGQEALLEGDIESGKFNSSVNLVTYLRACWWPKDSAKNKIEEELTKEDMVLWFPERLDYTFLAKERKTDPDGFPIKYLNNPKKLSKVKFPLELLLRQTIPHTQLPPQGLIVSTVDAAYSVKVWANHTVMLTALIYGGRFYVINIKRGKYNEYDLPAVLAATANVWRPRRLVIEDSMGVKWMGRELRREMDKLRISIPVQFVSLGYGSTAKGKLEKAKPVLRLLGDKRLYFSNACEGLQELYNELPRFTGLAAKEQDDIVSALSLLADQFGAYADMEQKTTIASTEFVADRKSKDMHDRVYCLGRYANLGDEHPVTSFEANQMQGMVTSDPYNDPFEDLLG